MLKSFRFFILFLSIIAVQNAIAGNSKDVDFKGKTFMVKTNLSNNESYSQTWTFSKDGKKMFIYILDGAHKGLKDEVELTNFKVTDKVLFINWLALNDNAAKGNTISYVMDFTNKNLEGFFSMNPKTVGGNRWSVNATGTFEEVK